jgi:ATP-dependent Clp protease ATP-binding subunit ClpX
MGFHADPQSKAQHDPLLLRQLQPDDLLKFGLIPEFIGRLPVLATLDPLDQDALVKILTEPKNSLIRQYAKFFALDGVTLEVEPGALQEIACEAIRRKTGARALRAIIESVMLEVMYEVPSASEIKKVIVPEGIINEKTRPVLMTEEELKQAS